MTVRIGFIGVGGIAVAHLRALMKIDGVEIVSVFDVDAARARDIAEQYGAKPAESADRLLNVREIDAVFVCTPQFARANLEALAAERGIHVFAEKPLGLDMAEVRRKAEAIRQAGVVNASGYCLRSLETVQKARDYLRDKQIDLVVAARHNGLHPGKWWRQKDRSGGNFVDAATHQVDLIRYVAGEFSEVNAHFVQRSIRHVDPEATITDYGVLTFKLNTGGIGTISETCMAVHQTRASVEVYGPGYFVQLNKNGKELTIIDDEQNITVTSRKDPYYEEDKRFIEAVVAGEPEHVYCTYADALETLRVTLAANRSAAEQAPVAVSAV